MPTTVLQDSSARRGDPPRLLTLVQELRAFLVHARQSLDEEIRQYPTPIPRCDAQFNFLYEQRGRLAHELDAIAGLGDGASSEESCRRILDGFLRSARCSDLPFEETLRAHIAQWLSRDDPAR